MPLHVLFVQNFADIYHVIGFPVHDALFCYSRSAGNGHCFVYLNVMIFVIGQVSARCLDHFPLG